jgi:hypothetical protein
MKFNVSLPNINRLIDIQGVKLLTNRVSKPVITITRNNFINLNLLLNNVD